MLASSWRSTSTTNPRHSPQYYSRHNGTPNGVQGLMAKTAATASADSLTQKIRRVARSKFQLDQLRPGQAEAIRSLVKGRDTLVIQPTGYGKSAVYQIAGMMAEGMTVIVSPLIALQQDQLDALEESAA